MALFALFFSVVQYRVESCFCWCGSGKSIPWHACFHRNIALCESAVANVVPVAETMPLVSGKSVVSRSACSGSLAKSCSGGWHPDSKPAWISRKALWRESRRSDVVCHLPENLYFWRTSPVTYPCLLSALFLPAKRISRNCAESPEGTGIRSTGLLAHILLKQTFL